MSLIVDRARREPRIPAYAPVAAPKSLKIPVVLLALSIGAVFAVMAGLWLFAWPIADDFVRAVEGRDYGIVGGVWIEYATWSCRWTAGLIHFVLAAILPLTRFYGASLAAITLLSMLILSWFIDGVLELRRRSRLAVFVAAGFAAVWWAGSPSVNEIFFWRAAEVEYQLGWSAAIALALVAVRQDFATMPARPVRLALLAVAAFFVTGLHELAAALEVGLFAAAAISARLLRGHWRPAALAALAAAIIGLAIVVAAPGNGIRQAAVAGDHRLWRDVVLALWQALQHLALWLADPKTLAATAVLIALIFRGDVAPRWPKRLPAAMRWALPALLLAALAALYAVPYVSLAGDVPLRTLAGIHLAFLCGWLVVVAAWSPCAVALLARRRIDGGAALRLALIALALVLPANGNVVAGVADLRGAARSFHQFMVSRDATLRRLRAEGSTEATLPVIAKTDYPRSYVFHADIRDDAGFWINRWWARYYGFAAVRAFDPRPGDGLR